MDLDPRCWIYLIPPIVAERFGHKALGVNCGVLFCGYSAAAFIGPRLGAFIGATHHGNYRPAFS
jgi:OFA family oxalate/formate antiporter-like MFS transporter